MSLFLINTHFSLNFYKTKGLNKYIRVQSRLDHQNTEYGELKGSTHVKLVSLCLGSFPSSIFLSR